MSAIPTPRTDAAEYQIDGGTAMVVDSYVARQLERELHAANDVIEASRPAVKEFLDRVQAETKWAEREAEMKRLLNEGLKICDGFAKLLGQSFGCHMGVASPPGKWEQLFPSPPQSSKHTQNQCAADETFGLTPIPASPLYDLMESRAREIMNPKPL